MYEAEYAEKLVTLAAVVELIPARGTLSMGMAISEPPALLKALEDRVKRGEIEQLRVYYSQSVAAAAATILKYEYMDVIKPHPLFPTVVVRRLFERGRQDNPQVIFDMPGNFSAMPRTLAGIGIRRVCNDGRSDGWGGIFQLRHQWRLHDPDRAHREKADRRSEPEHASRFRRLLSSYLRG
jgi:acyl-CoA hydrolase